MKYLLILLSLIVICCAGRIELTQSPQHANEAITQKRPEEDLSAVARGCLERLSTREQVQVHEGIKPSYLSGDFDGDGASDVAVVIRGTKTGRNGVLICTAHRTVLLGADHPLDPPFSDMSNDNFVSSQWEVLSKKDVSDVRKSVNGRRVQVAFPKGDSIGMIWEDAICLIYSDGSRYRWVCGD
jgi:hypothetical protein